MTGIYKILSPSGKIYIGQSIDIKARWRVHRSMFGKTRLNNSFKKYGIDRHSFSIIHELPGDSSADVLTTYEQLYMDLYRACGVTLLNLREAGSRGSISEEVRKRIGESSRGRRLSESAKAKISAFHKGHKYNLGRKLSESTKALMSAAARGRQHSAEHNRKVSESKKGSKCYMYGIAPESHHQARKVINISTGQVFGTVKQAAQSIGMKRTTLIMQLRGHNKNKTNFSYHT